MQRVTGLGGVFFKCQDKAKTLAWYREHLGIDSAEWGGYMFGWREEADAEARGYTVWSPFPADTKYFDPSESELMVNYRVADLDGLLAALKAEGVEVVGESVTEENGKFGWILDPDGRKIELWEPVPSAEDPYLK